MEILQNTTLNPIKIKYPFWMKMVRNLFWTAIIMALVFLGFYIAIEGQFNTSKVLACISLILSFYCYFRVLRLLPNPEIESSAFIKRHLWYDVLQIFLFQFFITIMGDSGGEWNVLLHFTRLMITIPWLFFWLLYFSYSSNVKKYYIQDLEDIPIFDWVYLIRYSFFIFILIWGLFEVKEYFYDKRGILDILLNFTFAGIHIFIIYLLNNREKSIPAKVNFLLSIALSCYFVHHFAQYFFFSEELGEVNYHMILSVLALVWCSFWFYIFSKSNFILRKYSD